MATVDNYITQASGDARYALAGTTFANTPWTTYAPVLTQNSAVTATITYAKYQKTGRMVTVVGRLDVTGTGTGNNLISVTLPFTAALASFLHVGTGNVADQSTNTWDPAIMVLNTATTMAFMDASSSTIQQPLLLGQTGTSFNQALASGDIIFFSATYEATT